MNQSDFDNTFFVLDFDRCIADTDKAHEVLWSVMESEANISVAKLRRAKSVADTQGFTFDTMEYVAKELLQQNSRKTWQDIRRIYIATAKLQGILEPYVDELLHLLDGRQIPYGILTYGKESWQLTKLEAAGLVERGVPFEITQIEYKGAILTGWKRESEFIIPPALMRNFEPLHVQNIVFLDDKPRSFIGTPEGVRGICVRPIAHPLRPIQQEALPVGVDEVQGIRGAVELLFGVDT